MLKNFLKSAIRFIKHNKIFAGINLMGLSIALAASFIMLLFVINEFSYDRYHKNSKRVYRVLNYYVDFKKTMSGTPYVLATALKNEFPQIEKAVRVRYMRGFRLKYKEEVFTVNDAIATDSDIFDIFTLPLISGSSDKDQLDDQNSIVLSRSLAEKVFHGQNPLGQTIVGVVNNSRQAIPVHNNRRDNQEYLFFRKKSKYNCFNICSLYPSYCCIRIIWTYPVRCTLENKGNRY